MHTPSPSKMLNVVTLAAILVVGCAAARPYDREGRGPPAHHRGGRRLWDDRWRSHDDGYRPFPPASAPFTGFANPVYAPPAFNQPVAAPYFPPASVFNPVPVTAPLTGVSPLTGVTSGGRALIRWFVAGWCAPAR